MAMKISDALERTYAQVLRKLGDAKVPYVVGGAWAMEHYTPLDRPSPDLDLMIGPAELQKAIAAVVGMGGKLIDNGAMLARLQVPGGEVDLVHHIAQGEYPVDQRWVQRGVPARLFGEATLVAAPEYLIWSKAFIAARHRFDGADIMHLLRATHQHFDWKELQSLLAPYPELLAAYLNLFAFVYPDLRSSVPDWLWESTWTSFRTPVEPSEPKITRGPLIDSHSFEFDIVAKGFLDSRHAA